MSFVFALSLTPPCLAWELRAKAPRYSSLGQRPRLGSAVELRAVGPREMPSAIGALTKRQPRAEALSSLHN